MGMFAFCTAGSEKLGYTLFIAVQHFIANVYKLLFTSKFKSIMTLSRIIYYNFTKGKGCWEKNCSSVTNIGTKKVCLLRRAGHA